MAQAGAQYGYGLLWTLAFTLPLMTAIQEACARIGLATGKGIGAVMKERYGPIPVVIAASVLAVVSTINIAADIAGMAAAARLIVPLPQALVATVFALAILALEVYVGYGRYAAMLKWLALAMLAYPAVALIAHVPWGRVTAYTVVPHISFSGGFVFLLTALLGTTISPYLFFWQASNEVEDVRELRSRSHRRRWNRVLMIRRMRIDNAFGMVVSNLITWFILVVSATVLSAHGVTNIRTAADAARALEPLVTSFPHAGLIASGIFAVGVIGLGALAVPVLAGAASYALSDAFGWRAGLSEKLGDATGFYAVIAVAILMGLVISFTAIDPISLLVWAAVLNGVAAVPLIVVVGRIAADPQVMGKQRSSKTSNVLIGVTALAMAVTAIATIVGLAIRH